MAEGSTEKRPVEFRDVAAQWAVHLSEPLVPDSLRLSANGHLVSLTAVDPARTCWWFAGILADQVQTLPPDDPWRNLSARLGAAVRGDAAPDEVGAIGSGGAFGSPADGHDLVPPTFPSPMTDVGLVALAGGLNPWSAAALAFAADGWEACGRALLGWREATANVGGPAGRAAALVNVGGDAVRWALWRRRVYAGAGDDWFLASAFAWLWRAERLAAGDGLPPDEEADIAAALADEQIELGLYAELREEPA